MSWSETRVYAPAPVRCALILAAAIFWVAGCDAVARRTPQQSQSPEGAATMNQAQTAVKQAVSIPPIDEAEPTRLETATFATG